MVFDSLATGRLYTPSLVVLAGMWPLAVAFTGECDARPVPSLTQTGYLTTRPDDAAGLPANVVTVPRVPSVAMGQLLID